MQLGIKYFLITGREGWQLGDVLCQKKAWLKKFLNLLYFSSFS